MILCNSNELFADNRKRKPIFNARRKAKWNELVERLNAELDVDYSVERVKNNYHYRITSLKRNINRMMNTLKDGEDVAECAAFQQLSEIDKLLYDAIKSTCLDNGSEVPTKRKKAKSDKPVEVDNYSLMIESPAAASTDEQSLDNQMNLEESKFDDLKLSGFFESHNDDLKSSLAQMIRAQTETLNLMKQFMKENLIHQAKIFELVNSSTEILRETAANLSRPTSCPTCTDNFLESFLQACNNNGSKLAKKNVSR